MFSTLRSRLWFTYILVIGTAIGVVITFLVFYLARNPATLRQTVTRFSLAEETLINRVETIDWVSVERMQQAVNREDKVIGVRVIILRTDGTIAADSRKNAAPGFPPFEPPLQITAQNANPPPLIRDVKGNFWWYALRPLGERWFLVVASPRRFPLLRVLLSDELFVLVLRAGGVAILFALLLGLAMESWISSPLRKITRAAREMAEGQHSPIPMEGPQEVQDLAVAFNEMARKVHSSQRSQRDLVANVSHELKTPLTSIQGFAQAILDGTVSEPNLLQQSARIIHDEAGRMYRLVLDLLALSRLDAGTADLERSPMDLAVLVRGVVEKLTPQAERGKVSLQTQIDVLPAFIGDEDRLAQVFTNLVDNALKFTPPGGFVQIDAGAANGWIEVKVRDSGPGIPLEAKERVFERFYQLDPARKGGNGRGSGLGLAIAREIVLAHGGSIGIDTQPGEGCAFWVRLPVIQPGDLSLNTHKGMAKR